MFALLVTIALALTLGGTHAQISPPQPAVLSKAIETLNSSSLVRYLSNYAIGAIDQGVSDNYTRSILTTYPQLNDVRSISHSLCVAELVIPTGQHHSCNARRCRRIDILTTPFITAVHQWHPGRG